MSTTTKHLDEHELAVRALVDEMLAARQRDDRQRVLDLCTQLLTVLRPNQRTWIGLANAQLGYLYYEANNNVLAELYFLQSVQASPRSEVASLGVFSARHRQQRWADALSEVLRFVSIADSPEYRSIFTEAFVREFSGKDRELALRIRTILLNRT